MGVKGAVLDIRIVSDASGAKKGLNEAEASVASFSDKLDRASVASAGVLAGIGAIASEAYEAASALQQSGGAVETVYGAQAAAVQQLAEGAAQSVGLSTNSYQELAALMGSQLKVGGIDEAALVPTMDTLMARGADLAATFGGDAADAVAALSSALKGERDPIERYGISLSQAAIDAEVAAQGLDTSTDSAKKAAQTQATLALIMQQSADANGAFAREADTAAGQTQRASAEFENAKAALGDVLLPIVAAAAQKFGELAQFLVRNKDVVIPLVAVIGGLAAGIIAVNGAMRAYAIVQGIVNAVINQSPIMRLVSIIMLIVGAVVLMYQKFDWFRALMDGIGSFLGTVFDGVIGAIEWIVDKLSWIGDAASWVGDLFSASGTVTVTPVAGGSVAGMFGAAGGPAASYAPLYGAAMTASAGGGSTAGRGPGRGGTVVVNVNVHDAIDPIATGRTLERILRQYAQATGSQVALTVGGQR